MIAELERYKKDLERVKRELERAKWENELRKREYETWLQSETVEMPMFSLLEGPEQSAPTTVALAAEAPAAEGMTDTRVFPDTAASDASVERVAMKLTSAAEPSSKICGESRAFRYYNSSCPKHGSNSNSSNSSKSSGNGSNSNSSNSSKSSGNGSSSSSNDTTSNYGPWWDTTCVVALLRPFDPEKGRQRDVRRGNAVLGVDLSFDRGKSWG